MVRVLLIYPNIDCPVGVNHGLAAISGVLRQAGHETALIHVNEKLFALPDEAQLTEQVRAWAPDVVGFSVMSQQYAWAVRMAGALRAAFPDLPLVAGGVHCTMVPDSVVADGAFDVVAVGEAELAFLELVDALDQRRDVTRVKNMRFPARSRFNPRGLTPINNPVGGFPDLATLAPKHWELFDLSKMLRDRRGWLSVLTSRGCPLRCTYCFNREQVDRYIEEGGAKKPGEYLRHYPVERIIRELSELKARYPEVDTLIFDDDLFTLDRRYVKEFCAAYKASGLGLRFVVNLHPQRFDEDMAFQLRDAGCFMLKYGLESGSRRVRKEILFRSMSNDRLLRVERIAERYGLHTCSFVMFGMPSETREEVFQTLQLLAECQTGRFRTAIFYPFPGTAGYTIANDMGVIDEEKLARTGNYFDGSCLRLGPGMDLLVAKLSRFAHWYVNSLSPWPGCAAAYAPLVEEIESWDAAEWQANRSSLYARDRELSERLIVEGVRHYSLRYTQTMAVDSKFVGEERARMVDEPDTVPVGYALE